MYIFVYKMYIFVYNRFIWHKVISFIYYLLISNILIPICSYRKNIDCIMRPNAP